MINLGNNNASPRQPMMNNQNNRMRPQQQRSTGAPSSVRNSGEPMKFDSEFDFESANAKFEQEIEKEFDKLKIGKSGNQSNQVRLKANFIWNINNHMI